MFVLLLHITCTIYLLAFHRCCEMTPNGGIESEEMCSRVYTRQTDYVKYKEF